MWMKEKKSPKHKRDELGSKDLKKDIGRVTVKGRNHSRHLPTVIQGS
jgi:hypothetical protein